MATNAILTYETVILNRLVKPNLARLRPPGGNTRPEGIEQSSCAGKNRGRRRRRVEARLPTNGRGGWSRDAKGSSGGWWVQSRKRGNRCIFAGNNVWEKGSLKCYRSPTLICHRSPTVGK